MPLLAAERGMPVRKGKLLGFAWLEFPCPSKGKQSGGGKKKESLCLWKVQLLPLAPCLEGGLHWRV